MLKLLGLERIRAQSVPKLNMDDTVQLQENFNEDADCALCNGKFPSVDIEASKLLLMVLLINSCRLYPPTTFAVTAPFKTLIDAEAYPLAEDADELVAVTVKMTVYIRLAVNVYGDNDNTVGSLSVFDSPVRTPLSKIAHWYLKALAVEQGDF